MARLWSAEAQLPLCSRTSLLAPPESANPPRVSDFNPGGWFSKAGARSRLLKRKLRFRTP